MINIRYFFHESLKLLNLSDFYFYINISLFYAYNLKKKDKKVKLLVYLSVCPSNITCLEHILSSFGPICLIFHLQGAFGKGCTMTLINFFRSNSRPSFSEPYFIFPIFLKLHIKSVCWYMQ